MEQTYDQIVTNTVETEISKQDTETFTASNGYALPNWKMEERNGTAINGN